MHEMGMCEDVLHAIERRARGRTVAAVGIRTGAMLRVVPDAFRQSFELVAAGTVADGAEVELTDVPAGGRCGTCGATFEAVEAFPACPECGGVDVVVTDGDELTLEWLRYVEVPTSAGEFRTG
jgi:hydrogenase nickel incorporation protein HypA/HybF